MDTLESMRMFIRVIELGSFSAAARERNVGQPTMSKVVAALEESLGVRLLERSTTHLTPTEEGRRFYVRSKVVLEEYAEAVAEVRGQTRQLTGTLRVNAPVGLGELSLNSLFIEFLAEHPQMEIELILNDRIIDLVEEGVDIAIRLGGELPPNVIARQIATSPRVLIAAHEYINRSPLITKPEDLTAHEYLRYAGIESGNEMVFARAEESVTVPLRGRYRVNSSLALRQCFLEGVGLGSAPAWLVQDLIDNKSVVHLLPTWRMPPQVLHLVYPSRRYQPLRIRAFLDFLTKRIPKLPGMQ